MAVKFSSIRSILGLPSNATVSASAVFKFMNNNQPSSTQQKLSVLNTMAINYVKANFTIKHSVSGLTWKYDAATDRIRLNTGVPITFTTFTTQIAGSGQQPSFYGLQDVSSSKLLSSLGDQTSLQPQSPNAVLQSMYVMESTTVGEFHIVNNSGIYTGKFPYETNTKWFTYDAPNDYILCSDWVKTDKHNKWIFEGKNLDKLPKSTNVPVNSFAQPFPPTGLWTANSVMSNMMYGNGTYSVTQSAEINVTGTVRVGYLAFDKSNGGMWQATGGNNNGQWVQLQLPFPIKLKSYSIMAGNNSTFASRTIPNWNIEAKETATTPSFTVIASGTRGATAYTINEVRTFTITNTFNDTLYQVFRVTITNDTTSTAVIPDITFWGTF